MKFVVCRSAAQVEQALHKVSRTKESNGENESKRIEKVVRETIRDLHAVRRSRVMK